MLGRPQEDSGLRGDDDVAGHVLRLSGSRTAPTLVRLTSSRAGAPEGAPLAFAAQVVTVGGAPGDPPTGEVTFRVDGRRIGTASLDTAGQAVLDGVQLAVGVHAVVASYAGDERHAAATSTPLPQAVTAAATPVVLLVASPTHTAEGVVIEAELVDPRSGRLAEDADGELVFSVGGRDVGAAPLRTGQARLVLRSLPPGRLRATFAGDREHAPAEGQLPPHAVDPYPEAP